MARLSRRRLTWALLVLTVLVLHVAVTRWVADTTAGWGTAVRMPERLTVAFVREIRPAAPPAAAPAPPPRKPPRKPRRRAAPPPAVAASQVEPVTAEAPPLPSEAAASAPEPPLLAAAPPSEEPVLTPPETPVAPVADAASAPAPAVDWPSQWPASTRLSYTLTGWYRGEVHGSATVEWLRVGTRYQVHLDVAIGPSWAPLMSRRMSSDGELTADGLEPRFYEEETRVALASPRRSTIRFEPDAVLMPDGQRRQRTAGMQDAASQFVQLSWLFTTQPQRLAPGQTVEVPLALPRSVDRWVYDILAADELQAPFATLPVLHLKPRRVTRPGGDLVLEAWFAPTLLYLPVRILIRQDPDTFIDLLIDRPPLQGG